MQDKKRPLEKYKWVMGIVIIVMVFCVNHNDCITIINWAISLLEHLFTHNLKNYAADYVVSGEFFTNYSLFSNFIIAFWCLPVYLFGKIIVIPLVVYTTWLKILMAILAVVNTRLLMTICKNLSLNVERKEVELLFLISPVIALYSIGMGQIDAIAVVLLLLGITFLQRHSFGKMAIVFGISMLIKGFTIFAIAVVFAYLAGKDIKKILYSIPAVFIVVLEKGISSFVVTDYLAFGNMLNTYNFLPRVFEVRLNMFSPCIAFLMIIMFFVYYNAKEKEDIFCMNGCFAIYMSFFFFFDWSPQYLYYMLPFMVIGYAQLKNEKEIVWLWWGSNIALLFYGLLHFNYEYVNGLLFSESIVGKIFRWKDYFISNTYDVGNLQYMGMTAKTIWFACTFIMLIQLSLKGTKKDA